MLVINKRIQFSGEQKLFNYKLVIHTKQVGLGYFSPCIYDGHAKIECKWLKYMGLNKERLDRPFAWRVNFCGGMLYKLA